MRTLYETTSLYRFSTAQRITCLRLTSATLRAEHADTSTEELHVIEQALAAHAEALRVEAAWAGRDSANKLSPEALALRQCLLQRMGSLYHRLSDAARVARASGRHALATLAESAVSVCFPRGLGALHQAPTDALLAELSRVAAVLDAPPLAGEHGRLEIRLATDGLDADLAALEAALDARDAGPTLTWAEVLSAVAASEEAFARAVLILALRWVEAPDATSPLRHVRQLQRRRKAALRRPRSSDPAAGSTDQQGDATAAVVTLVEPGTAASEGEERPAAR